MRTLTLNLPDAAATARAGAALAPTLVGGMVVALRGDLGAGKTTFVRGVLRALGVQGPIKSPSYGLVEHYPLSSIYFYHIDFYRFADPAEWETSGLADCFRDDAVCLVEWPERVTGLLPRPDVALHLAFAQREGRVLTADAHSERGERCVSALAAVMGADRPRR
jgi:tRNA threonylcarbamoyladenosine biosynthesis protein TsaE